MADAPLGGNINPGYAAPAAGAFAVTPHDTNELTYWSRSLWIGGAGTVKVTMVDGTVVTFTGVPAGTILPVRAKIVWSAGTTATTILALY
jgi:hypothetical protein